MPMPAIFFDFAFSIFSYRGDSELSRTGAAISGRPRGCDRVDRGFHRNAGRRADAQQIEFVNEAIAFEHVQCAVDGDAVDVGIELLRAIQDGSGIEVALGIVHHLQQDFSLPRQAHAAPGQGFPAGGRGDYWR